MDDVPSFSWTSLNARATRYLGRDVRLTRVQWHRALCLTRPWSDRRVADEWGVRAALMARIVGDISRALGVHGRGEVAALLGEMVASPERVASYLECGGTCRDEMRCIVVPVPGVVPTMGLLTARQWDILGHLLRGATADRDLGERLFISERTAHKHIDRILARTGCHDRVELALWAWHWREQMVPALRDAVDDARHCREAA